MKTVYSSHIGKVKINDKTLSLVDKAVERVEELSKENKWNPSFEITLKKSRNGYWSLGKPGYLIIKVDIDSWTDENAHSQVMRTFEGKIPSRKTRVDLGFYGYEGWETAIDFNDLRELPNIYFVDYFVYCLVNNHGLRISNKIYREIDEQHWKQLSTLIYESASAYLKTEKDNKRLKKIKSVSHNFYKGGTTLEKLIGTLKEKPKE